MTQTGEQAPRTPLLEPPPHRPSPYERFLRIGITAWCGIGVIVLCYLLLRLMVYANPVIPPLLIAVVVVYLLNPVVTALERRGVPRVAGAGIVYLLFLCIVALIVSLLVPVVARQVSQVPTTWPTPRATCAGWPPASARSPTSSWTPTTCGRG
jgi:predicted PurR-regulated permease PerM